MDIEVLAHGITPFEDQEQLRTDRLAYAMSSRSPATQRAYRIDWTSFEAFCVDRQLESLPATAETVALYATWLANQKYAAATITRRLIVIGALHKQAKFESPCKDVDVRAVLKGIRRQLKAVKPKKKLAIAPEQVRAIFTTLPNTPTGMRDRAIIAIGFCGGLRRSEIADLQVEWISEHRRGLKIRLPHSKTDQLGKGVEVLIESNTDPDACPVRLLRAHLHASGITSGPVFRKIDQHGNVYPNALNHGAITRLVKAHLAGAGVTNFAEYGAHSLRRGFASTLDQHGSSLSDIMAGGRWKSVSVAMGYIEPSRDKMTFAEKLSW